MITIGASADALLGDVAVGEVGAGDMLVALSVAHAVSTTNRVVTIGITDLARELTRGLSPSSDELLPMLRRNDSDSVSGAEPDDAHMFPP